MPGGGTYTWEYRLVYTDAQGGEVSVRTLPTHTPRFGLCCCSGSRQTEPWGQARACGSSGGGSEGSGLWEGEMEWWAELQQRVNLYSTREVRKFWDEAKGRRFQVFVWDPFCRSVFTRRLLAGTCKTTSKFNFTKFSYKPIS